MKLKVEPVICFSVYLMSIFLNNLKLLIKVSKSMLQYILSSIARQILYKRQRFSSLNSFRHLSYFKIFLIMGLYLMVSYLIAPM